MLFVQLLQYHQITSCQISFTYIFELKDDFLYTSLQNRTTNRPAPNENSRTDSDGTGPQVSSGAPPLLSKLQPIWKNYLESLFARSGHLDTLCEADMINGDWMKQIGGCQEWR